MLIKNAEKTSVPCAWESETGHTYLYAFGVSWSGFGSLGVGGFLVHHRASCL